MGKEKQTIHYCTILSDGQWDFLLDGKFSALRQKCLHRLMTDALRTKTVHRIKGIEVVLEVGQAAASEVELSEYLGCNRKTVGKLIDRFNELGLLTTKANNRTSIHTLHFLTGWYVGGVLLTNPHYVKPMATAKGQSGGTRAACSNEIPQEGVQHGIPNDRQSKERDAGSIGSEAAALSSSLNSCMASLRLADGQDAGCNPHLAGLFPDDNAENPQGVDGGDRPHGENGTEKPTEAQDEAIERADNPTQGTDG